MSNMQERDSVKVEPTNQQSPVQPEPLAVAPKETTQPVNDCLKPDTSVQVPSYVTAMAAQPNVDGTDVITINGKTPVNEK